MKKNKIIFLDIDGVLNGYGVWNLRIWKFLRLLKLERLYRKHTRDPFGVHEEKVKRLAKIVRLTDAVVVMSSAWRAGWFKTPYENQPEDHRLLTDLFKKYNIECIDITPKDKDGDRYKEIVTWLELNIDSVQSFCVIDDESFGLMHFKGARLVQTSEVKDGEMIQGSWYENTGLKHKHIKIAVSLLNTEYTTEEHLKYLQLSESMKSTNSTK